MDVITIRLNEDEQLEIESPAVPDVTAVLSGHLEDTAILLAILDAHDVPYFYEGDDADEVREHRAFAGI